MASSRFEPEDVPMRDEQLTRKWDLQHKEETETWKWNPKRSVAEVDSMLNSATMRPVEATCLKKVK